MKCLSPHQIHLFKHNNSLFIAIKPEANRELLRGPCSFTMWKKISHQNLNIFFKSLTV